MTVCRGCCCGTTTKHPDGDHGAQLERITRSVQGHANLRVTDCLGPCEHSNVVVVSPSRSGRQAGGRPTWLGLLNHDDSVDDVVGWVTTGGPGITPITDLLDLHHLVRPVARPLPRS